MFVPELFLNQNHNMVSETVTVFHIPRIAFQTVLIQISIFSVNICTFYINFGNSSFSLKLRQIHTALEHTSSCSYKWSDDFKLPIDQMTKFDQITNWSNDQIQAYTFKMNSKLLCLVVKGIHHIEIFL